jgi:hypothetical protein
MKIMGCDIHCYIEYRGKVRYNDEDEGNRWGSFGGRINPGRNYGLFKLMAGVRGWGDGSGKLFEPKGLPEGLGYSAEQDNYLYITDGEECKCGEISSVTVETAKRWVESGSSEYKNNHSGKPTWVSHPDWHSHSWLSLVEYRQVLEKYKVVEQEDWERRERDRLDLIEKLKGDNSLDLKITEGNLLYELSEHYVEPKYHAILAAMDSFEGMGYESRLVFWFDN